MANKKQETAIMAQNNAFSYLADVNLAQMMADELDGLDITFERIKIPSGGATIFEVPGEDGSDTDAVKEFSAVILHHHTLQTYYKEKYTGGNTPPDCSSRDGKDGVGDPGGKCRTCKLNQFDSGENKGKACKQRRVLYLLREGEIFPVIFSLPTGSITQFTKYLMGVMKKQVPSNHVITRFSLRKETNSGGIAYSQAQFSLDRLLTPDECALIDSLSKYMQEYSKNMSYDQDATDDMDMLQYDPETGEVIEPLR